MKRTRPASSSIRGFREVFLFGDAEDAGNATAPFLDQLQFAKHAGEDGISDLGDALLDVLDRQAGEEESRAFDLDPVVKKGHSDGTPSRETGSQRPDT